MAGTSPAMTRSRGSLSAVWRNLFIAHYVAAGHRWRNALRLLRPTRASIPRVAGRARERDRVAHVGEAGDVGQRALEAEAEAGMRHRAVAAQIPVPAVVLLVDAALGHARVQYVEP